MSGRMRGSFSSFYNNAMTKTDASPIKAIIFDYGGVFDSKHEAVAGFADVAAAMGFTPEALYDRLYGGEAWRQAKTGAITGREYLRLVMRELDPAEQDVEAFRKRLFIGHHIDQAVVAIARRLARRYPLALLSNATDELETVLSDRGLHDLFTVLINSARVGIAKPDARVYQLALDGLKVRPYEALFIDDKRRNIVAAEALGIPCILFTGAAELEHALHERALLDGPVS